MAAQNPNLKGFVLLKQLLAIQVFLILLVAPVWGDEEKIHALEKFVKYYHRKPDPERVPAMLDLLLKDKTDGIHEWPSAQSALLEILDDQHNDASGSRVILAHAFGLIARGDATLVRLYESHFAGATEVGKLFLLDALRICGDDATRRQLDIWSRDPAYRNQQEAVQMAATFLADPKRQLPRDRPAQNPLDLDLLWADFLTTGEYVPIARILDILDQAGTLRQKINDWLKKNPGKEQELLEFLATMKLIRPGTKDELVAGDLELILFHDAKGRLRPGGVEAAAEIGKDIHLSEEELMGGLLLQGTASWSLQVNLKEHPRLEELLKNHYRERRPRSQDLIKKWLRIEQPKIVLDKESERLQGTWQAIAWEEGDPQPHNPKVDDPKVRAEILKFVRWTFEDNEWIMTRAFTVTIDGKTKVKGQGGTDISTYRIDASKNPKEISATTLGSFGEEIVIRAIYKFEEDVLRICMSKNERIPKEFSGKEGSDCILITLKKVPER
jgi:uncharacterized protein (TIGR03067 family)